MGNSLGRAPLEGARLKRRQGGRRTVGNSLGRAPLGRSEMEGREAVGNSCSVGRERDGSDDRVAGGETVGNSLGRASLGRSEIEATTGWTEGKP